MTPEHQISMTVNGVGREALVDSRRLLSDFIREDLVLTGTHVGCEQGACGACTVLFNGEAARSCLMFAVQANGAELETIEGLSHSGDIARLQELFSKHHALQCGYCTPGMLIIAHDLLQRDKTMSVEEIREGMSAALCRCTGYAGIVAAVCEAFDERGLLKEPEAAAREGQA